LQAKYAAYFAALVSAMLVTSGAVGAYFARQDALAAVGHAQQTQARFAAADIAGFMERLQSALDASVAKFEGPHAPKVDTLQLELVSLLRHHPEVTELRWLDADARERLALRRFGLRETDGGRDASEDLLLHRACGAHPGPLTVYFAQGSEPMAGLSACRSATVGVLMAEVDLRDVTAVIARAGAGGVTYVVDAAGHLIAHPDASLVLRKTDLSALPQVRRALAGGASGEMLIDSAIDLGGRPLASTAMPVDHLGWIVFIEVPLAEALRPVYAAALRSGALALVGMLLAMVASVPLARRMVRPIRELEHRAQALGDGRFEERIALHTGDELESLGLQFNRMAERLQLIHAQQEHRIAERTRELALANEAKTRFLAAASHDLRQPMHALALFAGELHEHSLPPEAQTLSRSIERSVQALSALVESLLDLSKLDVGAVVAEPRNVALQPLLGRMATQFAPSAQAKGIGLSAVRTTLWVRTDQLLLERILLNLVSNALRYTERGRVLIGARPRGDSVDLWVVDTGIGMEAHHLPRVFEEFYRARPGARDAGLGLGLAIVRRLATLLGHDVQVISRPGRGTSIRLRLPRVQPEVAECLPPSVAQLPKDGLRGLRVLVVDDEAATRDAIGGLLSRWDCVVAAAEDAIGALAQARQHRPDVVLCDLALPGGPDGVGLWQSIRMLWPVPPRCVFVTGECGPELLASARATGCPVLTKPTAPAKLRAVLEQLSSA
jgi:signal transduction histidine kinase